MPAAFDGCSRSDRKQHLIRPPTEHAVVQLMPTKMCDSFKAKHHHVVLLGGS